MKFLHLFPRLAATAIGVLLSLGAATVVAAPTVRVPAGVEVAQWDSLLKKHVNDRGFVAYTAWKANSADMAALDTFIGKFADASAPAATGEAEIAALINLYNALTIRWILQNYPTESIRELDNSWSKARWNLGGRVVSLDEIEHKNLRPLFGWKVHATIVCAARSCPPLQREAYTAANLAALTGQAYRAWLGREDLNRFDPAAKTVSVSAIFKWFKDDFTGPGALNQVLAEYGPAKSGDFFRRGEFSVTYQDYHWGLNDAGDRGASYSRGLFKRLF